MSGQPGEATVMQKIWLSVIAVGLIGLGYELRSPSGHAEGGSARIYQVQLPSGGLQEGETLTQGGYHNAVVGEIKGFACTKDDCYVITQ